MKRHLIKSGCGGCGGSGNGYIFELEPSKGEQPISARALPIFKQAGYKTSEVYTRVGVFFVEKNGMTANGPFGGTKIQVRCGGSANCSQLLDNLENTFKVATALPSPTEPGQ